MRVTYNNITLEMCELVGPWRREAIYDGPQYLWHQHDFTIRGVFNPAATAYRRSPTTGAVVATPGGYAPFTDTATRTALSQPRKQLVVSVGDQQLFLSPAIGFDTDADNGPMPTVHTIEEIIGIKTFTVTISFRVAVAVPFDEITVLSHLWTMTDSIDMPHYLTTRTIQGRAQLASDVLLSNEFLADDFRAALLHPVGPDMQRQNITIGISDDGNALEYTIVDTERPISLTPAMRGNGITDIKIWDTAEIGKPSVEEAFEKMGGAMMGGVGMLTQSINTVGGSSFGASLISAGISVGILSMDLSIALASLIPKEQRTIVCEIWGDKRAERKTMESIGVRACFQRLRASFSEDRISISSQWLSIRHDVTGKYVEVALRFKVGLLERLPEISIRAGIQTAANAPVVAFTVVNELFQRATAAATGNVRTDIMPNQEYLPGITQPPNPSGPSSNPFPTNKQNLSARGSFISQLVAQELQDAGTVQRAPPTPRTGTTRTIS